jgi:hypothetical protein
MAVHRCGCAAGAAEPTVKGSDYLAASAPSLPTYSQVGVSISASGRRFRRTARDPPHAAVASCVVYAANWGRSSAPFRGSQEGEDRCSG